LGSGTSVVTISNSGNNLENPVEGKDVLSVVGFVLESSSKLPGSSAISDSIGITIIWGFWVKLARRLLSKPKPNASHDMGNIDYTKNK
jgi:hypothetical protein